MSNAQSDSAAKNFAAVYPDSSALLSKARERARTAGRRLELPHLKPILIRYKTP